MTTSETTTSSETKNLAQMAALHKTPIAKVVIEYVESLLHTSPKSPHVLHVFNAVSKVSDNVTDIVPRLQLEDGTTKTVIKNSEQAPNHEKFTIRA